MELIKKCEVLHLMKHGIGLKSFLLPSIPICDLGVLNQMNLYW